jgi:beta-lactamase superfamily II metal-dependent hydrolase
MRKGQPKPIAGLDPQRCVSVRMYDVGFGDCFLLRIPTRDGIRKVLFDCGSIKSGSTPIEEVVKQVIADSREEPSGPARIDLIVATHRHRDHISGFGDAAWAEVEVGEVWMPWTEDPQDTQGRGIRETQNRLAALLTTQLERRLAATQDPAERSRIERYQELALNARSNENAMRTLQHGFSGGPLRRYLPQKDASSSWVETPPLPGVTIHVLGPSRDPEIIRDLDPPAGKSYLRFAAALDDFAGDIPRPFGVDWRVTPGDYETTYYSLSSRLSDNEREHVRSAGLGLDEAVAAALDKSINGTSLMLFIQVGAAALLFPGDAQWGTWRQVLVNSDYRKLLSGTVFYKVGHHGSHNATPVEFVEQIVGQGLWAMVSTNTVAQWPKIPKLELLEALGKKTEKVARSDQPNTVNPAIFNLTSNGVLEAKIPL